MTRHPFRLPATLLALLFVGSALHAQPFAPFDQPPGGSYWPAQPHNTESPSGMWDIWNGPARLAFPEQRIETFDLQRLGLPVLVPVLGQRLDMRPGWSSGLRSEGNRQFLMEPFYLAFATLAERDWLSRARRERLDAYSAQRRKLVSTLRTRLAAVATQPPRTAPSVAAPQIHDLEPQLGALEDEAERIRYELTSTRVLRPTIDASWLPASRAGHPLHVRLTALAGAQFYEGLSFAQRMLLAEIAMEQALAGSPVAASADLSFLPAGSRIRLPDSLPAATAEKVREFVHDKDAIKTELLEGVERTRGLFTSRRTEQLEQLAQQQAGPLLALEDLAESIRRDLQPYPYPDAPVGSQLPAALSTRLRAALQRKSALQRELTSRVTQLRAAQPSSPVRVVATASALQLELSGDRLDSRLAADTAAFNARMAAAYAALAPEMNALREELRRFAATQSGNGGKSAGQLARDFNESYTSQENWARYHDYYVAVLQPGLSPAARRALFSAAVVDLLNPNRRVLP
jgi:hypothetical protein